MTKQTLNHAFLIQAFDSISEGIVVIDADGTIIHSNKALRKILGSFDSTSIHENWRSRYGLFKKDGRELTLTQAPLLRALKGSPAKDLVLQIHNEQIPSPRYVEISCDTIYDEDNNICGAIGVFADVTLSIKSEERLKQDVLRDSLTGLFNRKHLETEGKRLLDRCKKTNIPFSLCLLDLDGFKTVNDIAGHAAGDRILQRLSRLLRKLTRIEDVSCRLGGDEFCILFPGQTGQEALDITKTIQSGFDLAVKRMEGAGRCSMSGGIASLTPATLSLRDMLKSADRVLYEAKAQGKNKVLVSEDLS